jgi:hypothetical protein
MDTPDLARLHRRYQRYEHLATHYQAIVEGLQSADLTVDPAQGTVTFHTTAFSHIPKSIPRGKPMAWYLEKYRYYATKASDARDLYWSLHDAAKKRAWEALDREGKLAQLREISTRMGFMEQTIREYRAKIPAWEHEAMTLAARAEASGTVEDRVFLEIHLRQPPHATVRVMTESLQGATAERDWLLDRL